MAPRPLVRSLILAPLSQRIAPERTALLVLLQGHPVGPRALSEGAPGRTGADDQAGRSVPLRPRQKAGVVLGYADESGYGASDGIVTTFAVVRASPEGRSSPTAVLVVGAANLAADGLSMGVGNFLSIRAHERARAADNLPEEEAYPSKHGLATFTAFVIAGSVPLLPYLARLDASEAVVWSVALTLSTMFGLGAARGFATDETWWKAGLESLIIGSIVAAAAYGAGAVVASLVGGGGAVSVGSAPRLELLHNT